MYNLYLKAKSERGEEGQGGREYIDASINYGYTTIMRVLVKPKGEGLVIFYTLDEINDGWTLLKAFNKEELPELNSARG